MPQSKETYHESYHQHSCGILGNKDVIDINIPGHTILDRFRRWWQDLFLVSGSDERSWVLFTSSQALRMERMRQYRKFWWKIHPYSKFRNFWDSAMLHVFILHCILIHINTSVVYGDISICTYIFDAFLELFIILDVLVNGMTAYIEYDRRRVVFDTYKVLIHYCSTKMLFHVASAVPLQWIMFLRYGQNIACSLCKYNTFITVAKFRILLILARMYECSFYWTRQRKSMCFFRFLRIAVLSSLTIMVFEDLCDTVHLHIMIVRRNLDRETRPVAVIIAKHGLEVPLPHSNFFVHEVFRVYSSLYLFTFLVPAESYYNNLVITLICYVVANGFLMWVFLELSSCVSRRTYSESSLLKTKIMAVDMLKCLQPSHKTKQQIDEYFDYNMAQLKLFDTRNRLYTELPKVLRRLELNSRYTHYVERVEYFENWPTRIIEKLVMILKEEVFLRNAVVAEPWVESEGLHIVVYGELAVYTKGVETGHLIDGDYFGELSLVTDSEIRISTVIAVTHCLVDLGSAHSNCHWAINKTLVLKKILILNKTQFRRLLRKDPEIFFDMKKTLKKKYVQRISMQHLVPNK